MYCNYKLIPSASLLHRELEYILTPDEYIGTLHRKKNVQSIINELPKALRESLYFSASKNVQSVLLALHQKLMKAEWIVISVSVRKTKLTETKLAQYPHLKKHIDRVKDTQPSQFIKANFKSVAEVTVLQRNLSFTPVEPSPDHKIVVEFSGQWPNNAASLLLSKAGEQKEKTTKPRADDQNIHRSLATFKNLELTPRTLYLTVPMSGSPVPLKLLLARGVEPVPKKTEMGEWDNVLIPVRPLYYATEEKQREKLADAKRGYVYVFWKAKLWRELSVTGSGYFTDVDVEYYRSLSNELEKQNRHAEGFPVHHIWLPYKLKGEAQLAGKGFALLYSTVQLSWNMVEKFEREPELYQENTVTLDEWVSYSSSQKFDDQKHIVDIHIPKLGQDIIEAFLPNLNKESSNFEQQQETKIAVVRLPHNNGGFGILLKDQFDKPYANLGCLVKAKGEHYRRTSDGNGFIPLVEFYDLKHVLVCMRAYENDDDFSNRILVNIGLLKPIEQRKGLLQRLQNHDFSEWDLEQQEPKEVSYVFSDLQKQYALNMNGQSDAETTGILSALDKSKNGS